MKRWLLLFVRTDLSNQAEASKAHSNSYTVMLGTIWTS